jgi:hypothetical protein
MHGRCSDSLTCTVQAAREDGSCCIQYNAQLMHEGLGIDPFQLHGKSGKHTVVSPINAEAWSCTHLVTAPKVPPWLCDSEQQAADHDLLNNIGGGV